MPEKHPNAKRIGGPGASHENREEPERSQPGGAHPAEQQSPRSHVSGGGGEADTHHSHDAFQKGKGAPKGKPPR